MKNDIIEISLFKIILFTFAMFAIGYSVGIITGIKMGLTINC